MKERVRGMGIEVRREEVKGPGKAFVSWVRTDGRCVCQGQGHHVKNR